MNDLPRTILHSSLWISSLASATAGAGPEAERLRASFASFRERSGTLATEIRRDLTELTVHDLSHIDALWEIGSHIAGDRFVLTPTEGYVLGGAFLLHDIAMSVAATPGGIGALREDPRWKDLVTVHYRDLMDRDPTKGELREPEEGVRKRVLFELLRLTHAESAERLALVSFCSSSGEPVHLIEDTELRHTFGPTIGRVAHSHWWSIDRVEAQFTRIVGAPHWCPAAWTVDPLKLACLLRVADAAHLDARRAPTFLRAVTELSSRSEVHWRFQEKLNKPYLRDDALVFTSGSGFKLREADAWWLCLENTRMVDRELRSVDALLAEKGQLRLSARRVAGVDIPERFATYVLTDDWLPINATVHVTDLPKVIESIGGAALYGRDPTVPVRELIQNGCDAIRARRVHESREAGFGEIIVSLQEEHGQHWLEVADTGVGMSKRVLTEFLLDFGSSFWGSSAMQEEFPGLLAAGLTTIGKYGIGFFSVFMIADRVEVTSRRSDAGAGDTLLLEFGSGLSGRPILRRAPRERQLIDGGTRVRLRLVIPPDEEGGLLYRGGTAPNETLISLCENLCPAIDVRLLVRTGTVKAPVIGPGDWASVDGSVLLSRMKALRDPSGNRERVRAFAERASPNLRILRGADGEPLGRALITVGWSRISEHGDDLAGVVTVGGLRASGLSGIAGVLIGRPTRASRSAAVPVLPDEVLQAWASEQADLVPGLWPEPSDQEACARYICLCGGDTRDLPIARSKSGWLSRHQLREFVVNLNELVLVDDYSLRVIGEKGLKMDAGLLITTGGGYPGLLQSSGLETWPERPFELVERSIQSLVHKTIAEAWGASVEQLGLRQARLRETEVRIGTRGGRTVRTRAYLLRKPGVVLAQ